MTTLQAVRSGASRERGAALIVGLIIMMLLAMLGLLTMSRATLEELMSGTRADQQTALQAAESALRDAESYIQTSLNSASAFDADCSNGLCLPGTTQPVWQSVNWDSRAITFASLTHAAPLPGLTRPPRYVIELLPDMPPLNGNSLSTVLRSASTGGGTPFRITAIGYGRLSGTRVMVQSVYVKQ